ncbi:MAG: LemA family protein [Rhodanobacter sp.]
MPLLRGQYNTANQRFPDLLIARATGFHDADFFAAENEGRAPVDVNLDQEPGA